MILAALKSNIDLRFFSLFPIKKEPAVIINTNATRETVKSIEFEIEKPTARASALTAIEIKKNLRTGIMLITILFGLWLLLLKKALMKNIVKGLHFMMLIKLQLLKPLYYHMEMQF